MPKPLHFLIEFSHYICSQVVPQLLNFVQLSLDCLSRVLGFLIISLVRAKLYAPYFILRKD